MAGERRYTRIPPESTGDRVYMTHTLECSYSNLVGGHVWQIEEDYVITGNSGDTFSLTLQAEYPVTDIFGATIAGSGVLEFAIDKDSDYLLYSPISGQEIRYQGVQVATTTSEGTSLYIPSYNLVGKNNSTYGQNVDRFGSSQVTFAEGQPQLDSFGKLRVSNSTVLGNYVFHSDILPEQFSTTLENSASVTWDSDSHSALLTNTTAVGDKSIHTTNTYHHYTPGISHVYMATLAMSAGQTNLVRYWGMFDAEDGFMFAQEDGAFGINLRSRVTGLVTNTFVAQADFNKDTLDGSGGTSNPSRMNIDLTKDNIYWMDVQWLGAGRVRFGVYTPDGERLVAHEIQNANKNDRSVTTTGSLPVCYFQANMDSGGSPAAISNTAEMRAFCSTVHTEAIINLQDQVIDGVASVEKVISSGASTSSEVYLATFKPVEESTPGNINHSIYWPKSVDIQAFDSDGADARLTVNLIAEPVISEPSFAGVNPLVANNDVEIDTSATYYGGGSKVGSFFSYGTNRIEFDNTTKGLAAGYKNYSDQGGTKTCTINAISASSPAIITIDQPQHSHREGVALIIDGITGTMSSINGDTVYIKLTGLQTAELYSDSDFTTPVDTSGLTYINGGSLVGVFGTPIYWAIVVKPTTPATAGSTTKDITVMVNLTWTELKQ